MLDKAKSSLWLNERQKSHKMTKSDFYKKIIIFERMKKDFNVYGKYF